MCMEISELEKTLKRKVNDSESDSDIDSVL